MGVQGVQPMPAYTKGVPEDEKKFFLMIGDDNLFV